MTGLDFGFGNLIALSLFFLMYIPSITVAMFSQFRRLEKLNELMTILIYILLFLLMSFFTLMIIRNFQASSFKYLAIYSVILTCMFFFKKKVLN